MSERGRRLVHLSGTALPLSYAVGLLDYAALRYLYLVALVVAVVLEVLRLSVGLDWAIYDRLTREYEADNPAGYALYVVSQTVVVWTFAPAVAIPAALMLCVGDPISGTLADRNAGLRKTASTLAVMFAVCVALAVPFLLEATTLVVAVAGGVVGAAGATLADGAKPVVAGYVVDDNLSSPPVAAVGMWAVLALAG